MRLCHFVWVCEFVLFFFKQKTAYEMRISDWSSDVCSSDLSPVNPIRLMLFGGYTPGTVGNPRPFGMPPFSQSLSDQQIADVLTYVRSSWEIGRASCRERACQYV